MPNLIPVGTALWKKPTVKGGVEGQLNSETLAVYPATVEHTVFVGVTCRDLEPSDTFEIPIRNKGEALALAWSPITDGDPVGMWPGIQGNQLTREGKYIVGQARESIANNEAGNPVQKLIRVSLAEVGLNAREQWFQISSILQDFMLCLPLDSRMWIEMGLNPGDKILVAKPTHLRTGSLGGGPSLRNGFYYQQDTAGATQTRKRLHSGSDPAWMDLEQIYPSYEAGDLILASEILDEPTARWSILSVATHYALGMTTSEEIVSGGQTFPAGTEVRWLDRNNDARSFVNNGLLTGRQPIYDAEAPGGSPTGDYVGPDSAL